MSSHVHTAGQAWQGWEAAMMRRGLAVGTATVRRQLYTRWLVHIGARWSSAGPSDVERFVDGLGPVSARRRADVLGHLHAFYVWAQRAELAAVDPTVRVDRPKVPAGVPRPARVEEVARALTGAGGDVRLAVVLQAGAGLRCCEVAGLMWGDVDLAAGTMTVVGKGGKARVVALASPVAGALVESDRVEGPVVWPTVRRQRARKVSEAVNAHLRACGVRATAHQLRHRAAVDVLEATGSTEVVQHFLGHSTIATTQGYARIAPARVHQAVARVSFAWATVDPAQGVLDVDAG